MGCDKRRRAGRGRYGCSKYNELRELVKHKARGTVRGDQESQADKRMGLAAEETFAPTVRHSTSSC